MWDKLGLETVQDVGKWKQDHEAWEKGKLWDILKENSPGRPPPKIPLPMMLLRARVNAQRCYEIYEFESEFSKKDVENLFKRDPQVVVDAIRNIGIKIYSDREDESKVLIRQASVQMDEYSIDPVVWFGTRELQYTPRHFTPVRSVLTVESKRWILDSLRGRFSTSENTAVPEPDIVWAHIADFFPSVVPAFEDPQEAVFYELKWSS